MKLRTLLLGLAASALVGVLAVQGQVPGINSTLNSVFTLVYDASTSKPTYSASVTLTPTGTPTDVCTLTGSATKTIRVRRVIVSGVATGVSEAVAILKRSTAHTAGDGTQATKVPYDSTSAASTVSYVEAWTNAPTPGSLTGRLADVYVFFGTTTTTASLPRDFLFGQLGSPVFLRGVAQTLNVSLEGQGGGGGTVMCTFDWTEDTDS